jgi:SPW repeat
MPYSQPLSYRCSISSLTTGFAAHECRRFGGRDSAPASQAVRVADVRLARRARGRLSPVHLKQLMAPLTYTEELRPLDAAAAQNKTTKEEQMPKGPIPLKAHAALEPLVAIVLIAAPWIFGFDDVGSSTATSIAVGVLMLISGMSTRWRLSVVKIIPLRTHFRMDLVLGALLVVAPFVFGDSNRGDATRFLVIMGALELLTALGTNWDAREEVARRTATSTGSRPSAAR